MKILKNCVKVKLSYAFKKRLQKSQKTLQVNEIGIEDFKQSRYELRLGVIMLILVVKDKCQALSLHEKGRNIVYLLQKQGQFLLKPWVVNLQQFKDKIPDFLNAFLLFLYFYHLNDGIDVLEQHLCVCLQLQLHGLDDLVAETLDFHCLGIAQ